MPRTKKIKQYEMDFKFPNRSRDLLFKPDGSDRYTVPELLSFAAKGNGNYAKDFIPSVKEYYEKNGSITSSQTWTLENLAADWCPEWDDVNQRFFQWYDSRPDMQHMYTTCAKAGWWFYDRDGQHHSQEEAKLRGWVDRPDHWRMFERVANGFEASRFRELNRDVVFDIGDQVVIRSAFKNAYRYDPTYGRGIPMEEERIGMVVEHKDEISRRSRGGKGSRMINVLWINIGEQKAVPERILKKYREKKA